MSNKTLIYLAVPYSHPSRYIRQYRFEKANAAAAEMMRAGDHVFSPISHTHPIALAGDLLLGWEYWEAYDRAILQHCKKLVILRLAGWEDSEGIQGEIKIANELGIEVEFRLPPL